MAPRWFFWPRASFAARCPSPSVLPRRVWLRRSPGSPSSSRTYAAGRDSSASSPGSRAQRIISRLPPSLQKYTRGLHDAPVSYAVAFLILHEITAIVPLFGLFGLFHYTDYVPIDYMMGHYGGQVVDGVRRFEKYFRRKGWFGFGEEGAANPEAQPPQDTSDSAEDAVRQRWDSTDTKYKIVVEVGLAYAIAKALLPVRVIVSVWATPWFAGVLARLRNLRGKGR